MGTETETLLAVAGVEIEAMTELGQSFALRLRLIQDGEQDPIDPDALPSHAALLGLYMQVRAAFDVKPTDLFAEPYGPQAYAGFLLRKAMRFSQMPVNDDTVRQMNGWIAVRYSALIDAGFRFKIDRFGKRPLVDLIIPGAGPPERCPFLSENRRHSCPCPACCIWREKRVSEATDAIMEGT